MKKNILVLIILFTVNLYSQQGGFTDFLPLQTGNIWVYQCSASGNQCGYCTKRIKVRVLSSSVINGKTYFQSQVTFTHVSGSCTGCGLGLLPFSEFMRVDSLKGNVILYITNGGCSYSPNEILQDSFKARLHDSILYNCQPPQQYNCYVCSDTNNVTMFGASRPAREYTYEGFETGKERSYVKGIGLTSADEYSIWCYDLTYLRGCVINGVVYGDTSTIVGIEQISNEVPEVFSLSQNYPNPFNPTTNIKFQIAKLGAAKLIVFDMLGQEVATLVNKQLQPGTYETGWDASHYPSGVYFYKLITSGYSETRKMVLVK